MKYLSRIIAILILLALAFLVYRTLSSNKEIINEKASRTEEEVSVFPVRTEFATMITKDNSLELTGSFVANRELSVFAEGQGRITGLFVQEGQQISKGQRIAKLDDLTIQAQLRTAQAQLEKNKNDIDSYKRLLDAGAIAKTQLDDVLLAKKNMEANVASINQQFAYTTAYAPLSGVVKEVAVEQGSFATPGMKLATIVDVSKLKMIVKVPEEEVVKLKQGRAVSIVADVYPEHIFKGQIGLIGIQADQGRKYDVELYLNNSTKYPLKPGMYAMATIPTTLQLQSALYISRKAIIGSLKEAQVYVVSKGRAELVSIEAGEIRADKVEVYSGLSTGQEVVVTGQMRLQDGVKVNVLEQINGAGKTESAPEPQQAVSTN